MINNFESQKLLHYNDKIKGIGIGVIGLPAFTEIKLKSSCNY